MEKELELLLYDFMENHKDQQINDLYLKIYEDFGFEDFQRVLAYFHQELNDLFNFMNEKSKYNHHYNAAQSRSLLNLIDDLRVFLKATNSTEYKVILKEDYIDKIKEVKSFLETSGGSSIPDNYKELDIIKFKPIFHYEKFKPKGNNTQEQQIKTEAHYDDNTISIVLKKEVFAHIKELLEGGHYFNAVEESYKIVRAKLKSITGKEKAHEGFKDDNYEKIFGHKSSDDAEKDFFEGVKFLHMAIQYLRNEKAHTPAKYIDKNLAIHYIVLASLAYDLIDR